MLDISCVCIVDVGVGFWCAKLPNNILINYQLVNLSHIYTGSRVLLSVLRSRMETCLFNQWNLIAFFLMVYRISAVFFRSISFDGLTWHVFERLLEFRFIFFPSRNQYSWFLLCRLCQSVAKNADVSWLLLIFLPHLR